MFDFSGDEWFFFLAAAAFTVFGIFTHWALIASASLRGRSFPPAALLILSPILGLILTYAVLQTWSDAAVVGHYDYILLFMLGASAWMSLTLWIIPILGLSARDDVVERRNFAAMIALVGAILAVSVVYAFSNVGSGSTIWTTIAPAFVAAASLAVFCLIVESVSGTLVDDITIGRDLASGFRLAGALLGASLILGRAAGGSFQSWDQTWADMLRFGWPIILLAIAAAMVHRLQRPTPEQPNRPVLTHGIIPALVFVLFGFVCVLLTPHALNPSNW